MRIFLFLAAMVVCFSLRVCAEDVIVPEGEGFIVAVGGHVKKPGLYRVTSRATLFQALAAAGWVSAFGDIRRVRIVRSEVDDSADSFVVDFKKLLEKGGKFPKLLKGDMIYVEQKNVTLDQIKTSQ